MKTVFLFPGQGSQYPAMLRDLPRHEVVAQTLECAGEFLKCDVRKSFEAQTPSAVSCQAVILVAGVASARAWRAEGVHADFLAGHSVGVFAAAVTAGVLSLEDALHLVVTRDRLMRGAFPSGYGMAVVTGLDERRLGQILEEVCRPTAPVYAACLNAPRQIAIAGSELGLAEVQRKARAQGATETRRLPIDVPSHCVLMEGVADVLREEISRIRFLPPQTPCLGNVAARVLRDDSAIREDLSANVQYPVRWQEMMQACYERGGRLFLEMAPGRVLSTLCQRAFPDAMALAISQETPAGIVSRQKKTP